MCCSLMVTVRDISFPSHFWIVGYFAGSRLNFRVTITKGAEVPRSPFLPCVSLAGLGLRHLAGASRGVWKGQIRHRRKCGLLAVRVPCWEQRTEASGWVPALKDCFLWLWCPVLSPVAWHRCVSILSSFSSHISALSSAMSHALLSIPWWGFPFPAAHVSQREGVDSSVV